MHIWVNSQVSSQREFMMQLGYRLLLGNPEVLQVHNFRKNKDCLNNIGRLPEQAKPGSVRSVTYLPFFLSLSFS